MPTSDTNPQASYRPHDAGHNYYAPGIYLITLVTRGRAALFGHLNDDVRQPAVVLSPVGQAVMDCWHSIPAHNARRGREVRLHGAVCMPDHFHGIIEVVSGMDVPLGQLICGFKTACTQAWRALMAQHGTLSQPCTAADNAPIGAAPTTTAPIGAAPTTAQIAAGKGPVLTAPVGPTVPTVGVAGADMAPAGAVPTITNSSPTAVTAGPHTEPCMAQYEGTGGAPCATPAPATGTTPDHATGATPGAATGATPATGATGATAATTPTATPATPDLHRMSARQRAQYYAAHPEGRQPLFDDNYDDTICLTDPVTGGYDPRHFRAMVAYVADNPRRAIVRRQRPQFMEHRQHIRIAGRDYAAFGNLFLLRWARKVQVFCHRRTPDGRNRYVDSAAFRDDCRRWKALVMAGATVLVTPGISAGEQLIKNRCIEMGYPLIHIQKEPLPPFKKPEISRFEACARGTLLILSPWQPEVLGDYHGVPSDTPYSIFHNLNELAREICEGDGELRWVNDDPLGPLLTSPSQP